MALNISQLQRLRSVAAGAIGTPGSDDPIGLPRPRRTSDVGADFADTLRGAVSQVDAAQKSADAQVTAFVAGEQENVHEVMLAMNDAKLSFQLMTEVRNRMLETYQELMRMQV